MMDRREHYLWPNHEVIRIEDGLGTLYKHTV